jgi:hypothetical protein
MLKNIVNAAIDAVEAELLAAEALSAIKAIFTSGASLLTDLPWIAGAYIGLEAARAMVNSFEVGSRYIPSDQLAMVHQGEEIRTKDQAEADRRGRSMRKGKEIIEVRAGAFASEIGTYGNAKARRNS